MKTKLVQEYLKKLRKDKNDTHPSHYWDGLSLLLIGLKLGEIGVVAHGRGIVY